tara:strand:+ start:265 stop:510 length:246 start_codon:yes stop_codon:yes gene_type:complete
LPANIAVYLGIVWLDGDHTLLSWKEQTAFSIDSTWLRHYNQRVKESETVQIFPYASLKEMIAKVHKNGRLIKSDNPWNIVH